MTWKDILKFSGIGKTILRRLQNSPIELSYNSDFKHIPEKEPFSSDFYSVLDEMFADIQNQYKSQSNELTERMSSGQRGHFESYKEQGNVKGRFSMGQYQFKLQLGPKEDNSFDKHGRLRRYYLYVSSREDNSPEAQEETDELIAILLNINR